MLSRIKYLRISDITEYIKYKNPQHALLFTILQYSVSWLKFYLRKRSLLQKETSEYKWLTQEIKLIANLNKYLKYQIKVSCKKYDIKDDA
jgi:hypothetical protein